MVDCYILPKALWEELLEEVILNITSLCFFIAYPFKGHIMFFAGRVKIVSHSSWDKCNIEIFLSPLQCLESSLE